MGFWVPLLYLAIWVFCPYIQRSFYYLTTEFLWAKYYAILCSFSSNSNIIFLLFHFQASKERIASEFVGKVNEEELERAFVLIKDTYASNANDVFDKFGRYLKKNIFTIPSNTVLPEDRSHLQYLNISDKFEFVLHKFYTIYHSSMINY